MKHYYQIHNVGCVQAASAILLSYYGLNKTPADIETEVPMRNWPDKDELAGTINTDAAIYFIKLGFAVEVISFDAWVTDLSWQDKDSAFIQSRLQAASGKLTVPMIGRQGTELYIQAYLDYLTAGGKLTVEPYPNSQRIIALLQVGPVMTSVAYDTLHGEGKHRNLQAALVSEPDDINGASPNHNVVISRVVNGKFEIYDPWKKPGVHLIEPEQVITAISAAQQECDNVLVAIRKVT